MRMLMLSFFLLHDSSALRFMLLNWTGVFWNLTHCALVKFPFYFSPPCIFKYNMEKGWSIRHFDSFEAVVYEDLMLMQQSGLIPPESWTFDNATDTLNFNNKHYKTLSETSENKAWSRYIKKVNNKERKPGLVGRGMYEIQLRHWLHFFPLDEKTIVFKTEDMGTEEGTRMIVEKAIGHLELNQHYFPFAHKNKREYQSFIDNRTAELLEKFYAPYNARLGRLLGKEWDNPWPK